jgi:hypothetical protein
VELEDAVIEPIYNWSASPLSEAFQKLKGKVLVLVHFTFYNEDKGPLWPTIEALDLVFNMGLPLHDTSQLDELANGFYDDSGGISDGCVIAIDGLAVHSQQPYDHEVLYKRDCYF